MKETMTRKNTPRTAAVAAAFLTAALLLASPGFAQTPAVMDSDGIPTVAAQMHLFATRLDLSQGQQDQVRPLLEKLHDASVAAVHNESLSPQERFEKIRDARYSTDHKLRLLLSGDQEKQLDQLEQEPHPELHGGLTSPASLPQP
jgi:hypothetical protein